jgi:predicted butyrate kinase (DUF1464 family)
VLVELLETVAPVEMIVGPSGYGLPWVHAQELTREEIALAVLSAGQDRGRETVIGGMDDILRTLKASGLPIRFAPGVIHLPTVPAHRKVNRVDIGTADKLCAVALGVYDQARHLDVAYDETAFIYVELGGAFTALVAVDGGQVVDGMGGTSGPLGYLAAGALDGELAYLLGDFHKDVLCSGGAAYVAGDPGMSPEALIDRAETPEGERCRLAWDAFADSLVKGVAAMMTTAPSPREILLSGRLCRVRAIRQRLKRALDRFAPVRRVEGLTSAVKEAAQGAALIADGLADGQHVLLVEAMRLREATGTVLDHLYVSETESLRQTIGG